MINKFLKYKIKKTLLLNYKFKIVKQKHKNYQSSKKRIKVIFFKVNKKLKILQKFLKKILKRFMINMMKNKSSCFLKMNLKQIKNLIMMKKYNLHNKQNKVYKMKKI